MSNPKSTVGSKWAADLQIDIYLPWEFLTEIEKDNLTSVLLAGAPHLRNSPENRCVDAGTGRHNYQAREQKRIERLKVLPHSHHNNSVPTLPEDPVDTIPVHLYKLLPGAHASIRRPRTWVLVCLILLLALVLIVIELSIRGIEHPAIPHVLACISAPNLTPGVRGRSDFWCERFGLRS